MFETLYLTSAEKREFLQEFVCSMAESMETTKKKAELTPETFGEEETDKEREEALEKVKLIIRQFPKSAARKPFAEENINGGLVLPEATAEKQPFTLNEKIDNLLEDSKVRVIECSEGNVRIRKDGLPEETGFRISEMELKAIIEKLSEKARIPVQEGVFKAKIENLTINAVISSTIGTRLLIIKG